MIALRRLPALTRRNTNCTHNKNCYLNHFPYQPKREEQKKNTQWLTLGKRRMADSYSWPWGFCQSRNARKSKMKRRCRLGKRLTAITQQDINIYQFLNFPRKDLWIKRRFSFLNFMFIPKDEMAIRMRANGFSFSEMECDCEEWKK